MFLLQMLRLVRYSVDACTTNKSPEIQGIVIDPTVGRCVVNALCSGTASPLIPDPCADDAAERWDILLRLMLAMQKVSQLPFVRPAKTGRFFSAANPAA